MKSKQKNKGGNKKTYKKGGKKKELPIITNENIRKIVEYFTKNQRFPKFLRGKTIGDLDVSNVTNMSELFKGCKNFNDDLSKWDVSQVTNMAQMFMGCKNFEGKGLSNWKEKVSNVTNMNGLFLGCNKFNEEISKWNVEKVDDMSYMFGGCLIFDRDISHWNVSKVTNMSNLFKSCELFNNNLSSWDVSQVTKMSNMFAECTNFEGKWLSNWNAKVSNVTSFFCMFYRCTNFNSDLSEWNVSKVTDMAHMFRECPNFEGKWLSSWNAKVSNVNNMSYMFYQCPNFNSNLSDWNVSQVLDMAYMFYQCPNFEGEWLSSWNAKVSNVINMASMFYQCPKFNSDLSDWNVSEVTNMTQMFCGCPKFNSDLSRWDVSQVTNMSEMFRGCTNFNSDLSRWVVRRVRNMNEMFIDCPLPENFKPQAIQRRQVIQPNIHMETGKIDFDSLKDFFTSRGVVLNKNIKFRDLFEEKIQEWINLIKDETTKKKEQEKYDFLFISRLKDCGLNDYPRVVTLAHYALLYVDLQSPEFKTNYITAWIDDCSNAYPLGQNEIEKLSCVKGMVERFYQILNVPCSVYLNEKPEEYKLLLSILNYNLKTLILEYIKEWFQNHNSSNQDTVTEFEKIKNLEKEEKIKILTEFVESKFPANLKQEIKPQINEFTKYMNLEKEDFQYGGKKTKKTKKNKEKQRKRKTRK